MNDAALAINSLAVRRGGKTILQRIDFLARSGQMIGILGANGSGKSTLLRAIIGTLPIHNGEVFLRGTLLNSVPRKQRARLIGYLPQSGTCHWALTVRDLAALGRLPHAAPWSRPGPEDARAVEDALQQTAMTDFSERVVDTLSGGELSRALLARVLAGTPEIILADEPLANLDPYHQLQIMECLQRISHSGKCVVVVLHDLSLAARFCDSAVLLHDGKVLASGTPAEVIKAKNLRIAFQIEPRILCDEYGATVVPWQRLNPPIQE